MGRLALDAHGYGLLQLGRGESWETLYEQGKMDYINRPMERVRLEAFFDMTQDFIDGVRAGRAPSVTGEDGLAAVAMVEAGRPQSDSNFTEHTPAFELKYRDRAPEVIRKTRYRQKECYACMEYNYDWFCNDLEEPYTTPSDMPFSWEGRMRVTGGRTNVWGRQSYRLGDLDFKAASGDGYGEDWPLSYKDLVPYYDLVEEYVGITGITEGVYELPDGKFHPPMGLSCAENLLRNRVSETYYARVEVNGKQKWRILRRHNSSCWISGGFLRWGLHAFARAAHHVCQLALAEPDLGALRGHRVGPQLQ